MKRNKCWGICKETERLENIIDKLEEKNANLTKEVWELYEKHHPYLATRVIEFGDELRELLDKYQQSSVERPQAEWIKIGSLGNGNAQYECSNCHHGDEHAESQEVPYCWHCGAKLMKEGVKNDT